MKIAVFGWYGTETIGDRGILLGLLKVFCAAFGSVSVRLGTFYPFYTERTLSEDMDLAVRMTGRNPDIALFHSRSPFEIIRAVRWADIVVIGGGPMMHFDPLYMFEFTIRLARRLGKRTALLACGVGPLNNKAMQHSFVRMTEACDLVLLRDGLSEVNCRELFSAACKIPPKKLYVICDPAVFCTMDFHQEITGDYFAVNLREFPEPYASGLSKRVNGMLQALVNKLAEKHEKSIVLVPMHYFHVGTDDRVFLHKIAMRTMSKSVTVTERVLSLEETMRLFAGAELCVGMRFHSILFQTLLNGNNHILDYTDPKRGKIAGFIREISGQTFYAPRYTALQTGESISFNMSDNNRFEVPPNWREERFQTMVGHLKLLLE